MYLYRAIIYKEPKKIGVPDGSHAADKSDFETNYMQTATKVNEIVVSETTFVVEKSFTNFKALIDGVVITWGDVKYMDGDAYKLNLLSGSPL